MQILSGVNQCQEEVLSNRRFCFSDHFVPLCVCVELHNVREAEALTPADGWTHGENKLYQQIKSSSEVLPTLFWLTDEPLETMAKEA